MNDETATIHSDGSCINNPGPGGYAAALEMTGRPMRVAQGGEHGTTNNKMELNGAIAGLRMLDEEDPEGTITAVMRTDSQYICKGFNDGWIANWKKNGWTNAKRQSVSNRELWTELDRLASKRKTIWQWVKGHAGNPMNELCDRLAGECAREVQAGGPGQPFQFEDPPQHKPCRDTPEPGPSHSGQEYAGRDINWIEGVAHGLRTALDLCGGSNDYVIMELEAVEAVLRDTQAG